MPKTLEKPGRGKKEFKLDLRSVAGLLETNEVIANAVVNGEIASEQGQIALKATHGNAYIGLRLPIELNMLWLRFKGEPPVPVPLAPQGGRSLPAAEKK